MKNAFIIALIIGILFGIAYYFLFANQLTPTGEAYQGGNSNQDDKTKCADGRTACKTTGMPQRRLDCCSSNETCVSGKNFAYCKLNGDCPSGKTACKKGEDIVCCYDAASEACVPSDGSGNEGQGSVPFCAPKSCSGGNTCKNNNGQNVCCNNNEQIVCCPDEKNVCIDNGSAFAKCEPKDDCATGFARCGSHDTRKCCNKETEECPPYGGPENTPICIKRESGKSGGSGGTEN